MSFQDEYREIMAKPIEEIREDIFFRADNFRGEPWYNAFNMFLEIGVCQPREEHKMQVRKALKVMGFDTHTSVLNGEFYVLPGEARQIAQEPQKHDDLER